MPQRTEFEHSSLDDNPALNERYTHTPSTSKFNLISISIARINNVKVVHTIRLCQEQDGDINLRIYDLILDSVSVFCEFSHLSHPIKPVQQVQRVFGGKKFNFTWIEFYCKFFQVLL